MEKISRNCYKGKLLTNPQDIIELVNKKRSVYIPCVWNIIPAAIFINMPFFVVMKQINNKNVWFVVNNTKNK